MASRDFPTSEKIQVPDPCKFLSVLYEIWFREHGADVTCTVERLDGGEHATTSGKGGNGYGEMGHA